MLATFLQAALLAAHAACAAPLTPNLIPDPGFEGKNAWSLTSWEACEFKSEYVAEAHGGQTAVHLHAIRPGQHDRISALAISQPFAVTGGQEYLLSLWYRTGPGETSPAAVSVLCYKQPFATAQFKTPNTAYTTLPLPASSSWRLWTFRYRVPMESVEAVVAPRVNAVGELWLDDICFVPAAQVAVDLEMAGTIVKLPDTRRYRGRVLAPADAATVVEVYSPGADKPLVSTSDRVFDFQHVRPAGQTLLAAVVDPATRTLYASADLPAPPVLEFELTYPCYRRSIYATDRRDAITGQMRVNAAPELLQSTTCRAVLLGAGPLDLPDPDPARASMPVRIPLPPGLKPGKYTAAVAVDFPGQTVKVEEQITVLPPAPEGSHEVTLGPDHQLLMDGKPYFARGFMGGNPQVYGPVAKAGYNVGMTFGDTLESVTKFLDGCRPLGMTMVTGLPCNYMSKQDPEGLRQAIRQVRNHPSLLGYYFPDEPSPNRPGLTPGDFATYYQIMREEDPYHPVMTTLCEPELADDYEKTLDIICLDPYPVTKSRRPLTMVSDWIFRVRELTGNRRPVWFVPQAFGGDVIEGCPDSYAWLTPSPEQTRCMVYLGLASGAQGLLPYCYHVYTGHDAALQAQGKWPWKLGGYLPEKQPALWGAYAQIGPELERLTPALTRAGRCWSEQGLFLREMSPANRTPGYLIAVNPSEDKTIEAVVRLQTPLPQLPELEEMHRAMRRVKVAGNEVTLKLEPMQVGLYLLPSE